MKLQIDLENSDTTELTLRDLYAMAILVATVPKDRIATISQRREVAEYALTMADMMVKMREELK